MNPDLEKIIKAAKAGGEVLRKYFGESLDVIQKTSARDFKTKADDESEAAILKILTAEFPDYNIFAEESGELDKGSAFTFAIDPLDGTNNFVLGIPNFSVSIGLLKDDEVILGAVYNPVIDNMYYAEKGGGSYMDGERLYVNSESDIKNATIANNFAWEMSPMDAIKIIEGFYKKEAKRVLSSWSPAFDFCLLASGRVEGLMAYGPKLHDFAAGKLIVREAGAMITDMLSQPETDDRNDKFIVSNSPEIHKHIVEVMNGR